MIQFEELDWFDSEVDNLQHALSLIDERIQTIESHINPQDPDTFGYYHDIDYLTGLAFVACQRYITSVYTFWKQDKETVLDLPPLKYDKLSYAAIINAVANYWKHHQEWDDSPDRKSALRIIGILKTMEIADSPSYIHGNALWKLGGERMQDLIPHLKTWRNNVANQH
jgi:hypothetical protein